MKQEIIEGLLKRSEIIEIVYKDANMHFYKLKDKYYFDYNYDNRRFKMRTRHPAKRFMALIKKLASLKVDYECFIYYPVKYPITRPT